MIEELGRQVSIGIEDLKKYEELGLLESENLSPEKQKAELQVIELIDSLAKLGVGTDELKRLRDLMNLGAWTKDDQLRLLRKCRFRMLDDIHIKQQSLDRMDYIIHTMKQNQRKVNGTNGEET